MGETEAKEQPAWVEGYEWATEVVAQLSDSRRIVVVFPVNESGRIVARVRLEYYGAANDSYLCETHPTWHSRGIYARVFADEYASEDEFAAGVKMVTAALRKEQAAQLAKKEAGEKRTSRLMKKFV